MGSSGKKKTTMAKHARENRLRERRLNKQAKKDARKLADPEPTDPRDKEVALQRLRDASDEELAVFESQLQDGALQAGASELEMRQAQRNHPGHAA